MDDDPPVDDDPLEKLSRLGDQADRLFQQAEAAAGRTGAEYSGEGGSGTVRVTLAGTGRVRDIRVTRDWRDRVGLDGLSAAVEEAIRGAGLVRLREWATAYAGLDGAPEPRPRPWRTTETLAYQLNELATGPLRGGHRRAALEELLRMAEAVERGIDQASAQIRSMVDARYVGRSRQRHVTVTVAGNDAVTGVGYERRWLLRASELDIGAETVEAFRTAYSQVPANTPADLIAGGPLGDVQALGQDPLGLARRLRLRAD